jgi:hypothetical protein
MALGHLVPEGPQDLGRFAGHSQEQGAVISPGKEPSRRCPGLPQATEGRADG